MVLELFIKLFNSELDRGSLPLVEKGENTLNEDPF